MTVPVLNLSPGDAPFTESPAKSYTMPARFYFDPAIYELEKSAIFYRSWWYAGHKSQLASPGCFVTTKVHDQNVFVVRARDGELKGFYNVCQHRGHELLSGSGRTNVITCPYHAWAYDFEGTLRSARHTDRIKGFKACDFALKPVRVEEMCGLVFVNLDMDATPFAEQATGLEAEIRRYCPAVDDMVFAQRDTYDVASNWKVLIDNFLECYHCHTAHKDFVDLVDMESYRSRTCGIYSSHCSGAARTTQSSAYVFEKGDVDFGYAGWFVWPNLTIWIYPGEPNISTLQMIPDGPDRTIEHQDWFIPTPTPSAQLRDAMVYQKDVLQPEDIALCESVQKGLKSRGYNQGRFVVDEELSELSEHAVHHFQKLVVEALGADLDPASASAAAAAPAGTGA
ncbi:carnitine monooxygenase subunit YeaW [Paralimibaculum aggregatum]|uniref:Carnitine monooxygenase subunit YeaW n=1 Tax=Paralimibaculum aggregatum TaxID=3036245 RepID=A0ABQ6LQD4_9RHOB|nr:aromatic ring-hydroxylating dioxygenase subunit alpha [Limibaculum sp. NKW23]GMG82735.1 carnitine monooxygenase subunit YeaW [Limibaculum sp. NKW23]